MKFYLDMLFCRTDNGLEVLVPPLRVMVSANWKTAGEQNAPDGFHTLRLNRSLMELGTIGINAHDIYSNASDIYGIDLISAEVNTLRYILPVTTFLLACDRGFIV